MTSSRRAGASQALVLIVVLLSTTLGVAGAAHHGPPTAPERVLDGHGPGPDVDVSPSSLHFAARWSRSIDETGQPVTYQLCLRERDERCDHARWFAAGSKEARLEAGTLQMTPGDWLLSCIRARDVGGSYSEERCSDGFRVVPADSEITSVMEDRARVGLPADRATVEQQARRGDYGTTWLQLDGPVIAPGEQPDFRSLEFQTWMLDHGAAVDRLVARGIIPQVPPGDGSLDVVVAQRTCSARSELRRALGPRLVELAPTPPDATVHPRPSDALARRLLREHVLADPAYRAIGIEDVSYRRRGVAHDCLEAIAGWLARGDVRRSLARAGFAYANATLVPGSVIVSSDAVRELPGASDVIRLRAVVRGASMPS